MEKKSQAWPGACKLYNPQAPSEGKFLHLSEIGQRFAASTRITWTISRKMA